MCHLGVRGTVAVVSTIRCDHGVACLAAVPIGEHLAGDSPSAVPVNHIHVVSKCIDRRSCFDLTIFCTRSRLTPPRLCAPSTRPHKCRRARPRGPTNPSTTFTGSDNCSARSGLSIFAAVFEECATVPAKEPHTNRRHFKEIAPLYRLGYAR